ncbi:V-type proton ATPase 116 kDa subunit a 1 isoform X1 [Rhipicephalus sanguineus]|uniref:V-type proton ATPase 116 kDa subunit a 1 isoform X1 n=1 Tax=Rhipicephalus sanguineus TaxID=34632 RepID=UPI001895871A|nr:V-type proton ATPase 116 kDa subunit a 1 isoform X1 [Rhipicephalus sanguineus]
MGGLFRSEEMTLCQLFLQSEAAYGCVSELGELGLVQFRDLNPDVNAFQRKFVNEVRRCDEMERKLRFLEKEIKKDGIPMLDIGDNPEAPQPREMIDLEATFEKLENELKEVNTNAEALKKTYLELTELKHILRKTQAFFDEAGFHHRAQMHDPSAQEEHVMLLGDEGLRAGGQALRLGFVAGVVLRERLPSFERMLWRVCRGNVFLRQAAIETPLEDPVTGDQVYKTVFIIFFQGEQLKTRVKKICEGFRATLYPCPETPADRREMSIGVMTRIEDLNTVLGQTQDHRHRVLVAAAKNIKNWFVKVRKIKAIYHALNLFNLDVTQKCLIAECWCAVSDLEKIQMALHRGTDRGGNTVPSILNRMETKETPPTYNRTNRFTVGFQNIVDAYAVPSYREVNPAPFTIITFPFLFAVMFGDAGHGTLMFLFALWMVLKEKALQAQKSDNEIWNTFFGGRYIILLMGIFSIYTGIIYNDTFSKSFNIFGSSWFVVKKTTYNEHEQLDPVDNFMGSPYPFGVDPAWQLATNKIPFTNSYKMKMSIVLGVSQMLFGVFLSLWNHRFFRNMSNVWCEFVPQLLFLCSIFGYLVIIIFAKWTINFGKDTYCAPSLLITLINMFLFSYPTEPCYQAQFYNGQQGLQSFLVILAVICIPWILLAKPLYLRRQHQMALRAGGGHSNALGGATSSAHAGLKDTEDGTAANAMPEQPKTVSVGGHGGHGDESGEFNFGDTFINQTIHTIEYCLGSVSHTASYLRLWALSLAHAQLSEVLWTMVLKNGLMPISVVGGFLMYFTFAAWAFLTVAVLLIMEGLSAFLHALRLHWVEFQSKFYKGEGYMFVPFSFDTILETSGAED